MSMDRVNTEPTLLEMVRVVVLTTMIMMEVGVQNLIFGEANETAHVREEWMDTATGAAHAVMVPMQKALYSRTSHDYAGFNTNIPDQFRMEQFERNFTKMWLTGKQNMPQLITIQ